MAFNVLRRLTMMEAFLAISKFLQKRYERVPTEELASILSDIAVQKDGKPTDPATWIDWEESVNEVVSVGETATSVVIQRIGETDSGGLSRRQPSLGAGSSSGKMHEQNETFGTLPDVRPVI